MQNKRNHPLFPDHIVEMRIDELKALTRNARTHPARQIRKLANAIGKFGFLVPVLVDGHNNLLAGHARIEAARRLGLMTVPAIRVDHLSEGELRLFRIADNKLATLSGWDREILAEEFEILIEHEIELDVSGFEIAEIDALIVEADARDDIGRDGPATEDDIPVVGDAAVSRPGDNWVLGNHRLVCGDARDLKTYDVLLGKQRVRMTISDPPFNVAIHGHVSGLGRRTHREFEMASGEMTRPAFTAFLETAFRNMAAVSFDGALAYVFMDWRHLPEALTAGNAVFDDLINLCVWDKGSGGMGSLYRSAHEMVLVFKTGQGSHINTVELGRHGRNRINIWRYRGMASFGRDRDAALDAHPTVKPTELIADAILDVTRRGDLVLDSFAGSGTILVAAEKTGRHARAIEIDPLYVDTAVRRWQSYTGRDAIFAGTKLTFDEVAKQRAAADTFTRDEDSSADPAGEQQSDVRAAKRRITRKRGAA